MVGFALIKSAVADTIDGMAKLLYQPYCLLKYKHVYDKLVT